MDWNRHLQEISDKLATFRAVQPYAGHGFTGLHRAAMAEGVLTLREKELIARPVQPAMT